MHSDALATRIIAAENEHFQDDRIRQALSLENVTYKLIKTCERLERVESNGRDFLLLLRKELKIQPVARKMGSYPLKFSIYRF